VRNPNIFFFFLRSFDTVIQIGSQKEFASLMLCRITFHYAIPFLISAHTQRHAVHAAEYAVKAVFPEQREEERAWQYRHLLSLTRQPDTAGGDPDPDIA